MKFSLSKQINLVGIILLRMQNVLSSSPATSSEQTTLEPSTDKFNSLKEIDKSLISSICSKFSDNIKMIVMLKNTKNRYLKAYSNPDDSFLVDLYRNILSGFKSYKLNKELQRMIKESLDKIIDNFTNSYSEMKNNINNQNDVKVVWLRKSTQPSDDLDITPVELCMEEITEDFVYLNVFLEIAHKIEPENIQNYNRMKEELKVLIETFNLLVCTNESFDEKVLDFKISSFENLTKTCAQMTHKFFTTEEKNTMIEDKTLIEKFMEECNSEIQEAIDVFIRSKRVFAPRLFLRNYCYLIYLASSTISDEKTLQKVKNEFIRFENSHLNARGFRKLILVLLSFEDEVTGKDEVERIDNTWQNLSNIFKIASFDITKLMKMLEDNIVNETNSKEINGKEIDNKEMKKILFYIGIGLIILNFVMVIVVKH